jgi:hypothetical protein
VRVHVCVCVCVHTCMCSRVPLYKCDWLPHPLGCSLSLIPLGFRRSLSYGDREHGHWSQKPLSSCWGSALILLSFLPPWTQTTSGFLHPPATQPLG